VGRRLGGSEPERDAMAAGGRGTLEGGEREGGREGRQGSEQEE
jgi:hypothetical protein